MVIDFKPNEVVVKAGNTNHIFANKQIKGKLILTNQRIYFKALENDSRKFDLEIVPKEISEVHYFNSLFIFPNGLNIITKDGEELKFTVKKRNLWGVLINKMY